jgi:hypothetical protein
LGSGFLEAVYQEAMEIELQKAEIPYEVQGSFIDLSVELSVWSVWSVVILNLEFLRAVLTGYGVQEALYADRPGILTLLKLHKFTKNCV